MAARRADELVKAAGVLGVSELVALALPEGDWDPVVATAALAPLVSAAGVIYGPSCVDFHPDHLALAQVLAGLVRPEHQVRVYELGVPLTPTLANLIANTDSVNAVQEKALAAYFTQAQALGQASRLARYRAAYYRLPATEHFWALSGAAYKRVMAFGHWDWETSPFRGLRPRPTTDPLAYLTGRQTRQTLDRLAQTADSHA
jgi:LmbE family N-acetylglucosaminyl deacetylase